MAKVYLNDPEYINTINTVNDSIASISMTGCNISSCFKRHNTICSQFWRPTQAPVLRSSYNPSSTTEDTACSVKVPARFPVECNTAYYYDSFLYPNNKFHVAGYIVLYNPNTTNHTIKLKIFQGNSTNSWDINFFSQTSMIIAAKSTNTYQLFGTCSLDYRNGTRIGDSTANVIYIGASYLNPETTNIKILGIELFSIPPVAIDDTYIGMVPPVAGTYIKRPAYGDSLKRLLRTFMVTSFSTNGGVSTGDATTYPYGYSTTNLANSSRCLLSPTYSYSTSDETYSYFVNTHDYVKKNEGNIKRFYISVTFNVRSIASRTLFFGIGFKTPTSSGNFVNLSTSSRSIAANTTYVVKETFDVSTTLNVDYGIIIKPYVYTNSSTGTTVYFNNFDAHVIPIFDETTSGTKEQLNIVSF